jgi:tetratricopeptide (TPR) repeat protein
MILKTKYKIIFLVFVVLGVYYPAIFGGVNPIDDAEMILRLESVQHFDLIGLFKPGGRLYYRPLLMLTFWGDKFFWGLDPGFMILENILLHAFNAVWVFLLARKIGKISRFSSSVFPMLCALLFALHPINTESVNWISGRTDPLAAFFVLGAMFLLIRSVESGSLPLTLCASFVSLFGVISKETALFFIPAALFLIWRWPGADNQPLPCKKRRWQQILCFVAPFLICASGFMIIRHFSLGKSAFGLSDMVARSRYDLINSFRVALKVFGFYVKKLFVPLPLNFAIIKFSNAYVLLGVFASFASVFLLRFRKVISDFLIVAFYLILPGMFIALADVAWTPVAERYLYLSSAFFSISIVGMLFYLWGIKYNKTAIAVSCVVSLLIISGFITTQRNLVWQDKQKLIEDTMQKSPEFISLHNEMGAVLLDKGHFGLAERHLNIGIEKKSNRSSHLFYINKARLKIKENDFEGARDVLLPICQDKTKADKEVLKTLAQIDEKRLYGSLDSNERLVLVNELLDTYRILFIKVRDANFLYRGGQLALFTGDKIKAAELFAKAYEIAPEGAHYKIAAGKLATKLKEEQ